MGFASDDASAVLGFAFAVVNAEAASLAVGVVGGDALAVGEAAKPLAGAAFALSTGASVKLLASCDGYKPNQEKCNESPRHSAKHGSCGRRRTRRMRCH